MLNELTGLSSFAGYVWIFINTIFVLIVSTSVASLYAQNVHIAEALGSIRTKYQFTEKNISVYQLALMKINAIPLGVPFYSTKQFITWGIIIKVMTFVSSFYLFLASIDTHAVK